tara:strand:- start:642 stop:917 length:276 start_codon:yes stop_codon:yes gene_type:complete
MLLVAIRNSGKDAECTPKRYVRPPHPEHRAFVVNLVSNALMSLRLKELKPKTRFLGLNLMELLNSGMKGKEAITGIYTALEARAKSGDDSE